MPVKWSVAVREWNAAKDWKNDYYALPRKGGKYTGEIDKLRGIEVVQKKKEEPEARLKKKGEAVSKVEPEKKYIPVVETKMETPKIVDKEKKAESKESKNEKKELKEDLKALNEDLRDIRAEKRENKENQPRGRKWEADLRYDKKINALKKQIEELKEEIKKKDQPVSKVEPEKKSIPVVETKMEVPTMLFEISRQPSSSHTEAKVNKMIVYSYKGQKKIVRMFNNEISATKFVKDYSTNKYTVTKTNDGYERDTKTSQKIPLLTYDELSENDKNVVKNSIEYPELRDLVEKKVVSNEPVEKSKKIDSSIKVCPKCNKTYKNLALHMHKTHDMVWAGCCNKYVTIEKAVKSIGGKTGINQCTDCFN